MKTLLLISFFTLMFFSCNKIPPGTPNPFVGIHYTDKTGNDLFPNGANGYLKENVRTYTLINGKKSLDSATDVYGKVVYNPFQWGNVYDEDTKDSIFIAAIGLLVTKIDYKNRHYFTTLIDLKEGVEDTMQVFVNSRKSIDSLWYNGELLYYNPYWPEVYPMQKIITIQKEN